MDQHICRHQDKWNILQKKTTNARRFIKRQRLISTSCASRTIITRWTIAVGMTCCCNDIFLASTTVQTWTSRAIAQCSYSEAISFFNYSKTKIFTIQFTIFAESTISTEANTFVGSVGISNTAYSIIFTDDSLT